MLTMADHCPPLEQIAAFAEGRIGPEARARLVQHLDECESCHEVFVETVEVLRELRTEGTAWPSNPEAGLPELGKVLPMHLAPPAESFVPAALANAGLPPPPAPALRQRAFPGAWRVAASISTGVLLCWLGWRVLVPPGLDAALPAPDVLAEKLEGWMEGSTLRTWRGPSAEDREAAFRLGALTTTSWAALRSNVPALAQRATADLSATMHGLSLAGLPESELVALVASLEAGAEPTSEERALRGLEADLERILDHAELLPDFGLGRWLEAGRLAALAGDQESFASRAFAVASREVAAAQTDPEVRARVERLAARAPESTPRDLLQEFEQMLGNGVGSSS